MKDVFIFYRSYHEAMDGFSDAQYGKLMKALAEYALNGKEPEKLDKTSMRIFTLIKPQIDSNEKKIEGGKKGGRPKNKTIGLENSETENSENENHRFLKNKTIGFENEKAINDIQKDIQKEIPSPSINPSLNPSLNPSMCAPCGDVVGEAEVEEKLEEYFYFLEQLDQRPLTEMKRAVIANKLISLSTNPTEQIALIDNAMLNGYKNVYPLKANKDDSKLKTQADRQAFMEGIPDE